MIRPTDRETVSTGKTVCSSQAPGAGSQHVTEATAGSKGAGRRWGAGAEVWKGLHWASREGLAEAGKQAVEMAVVSPGAPGCLQLSGTCLGT